jgi:hypothetical protein
MGLTCHYRQITAREYLSFRTSPRKAYQMLFGPRVAIADALESFRAKATAVNERVLAIQAEQRKAGLYDRLAAVNFDPTRLSPADRQTFERQRLSIERAVGEHFGAPDPNDFSIDKAWEAIHFLLTGQTRRGDPPLADAVLGGVELPDDQDYTSGNPLRILSPAQVWAIADALADISADQLLARPARAQLVARRIYAVSSDDSAEDEYIHHHYTALREFFTDAAARSNAVLLYLA